MAGASADGDADATAALGAGRGHRSRRWGPVPTNGVRLALDRRAPALPVRSAIGGVAVAIVGAVAVVTFSASLDRLLATPDRWGFGWDLMLNFTADEVDAAAERLVDDERVSAAARWDGGFSYVDGAGRPRRTA